MSELREVIYRLTLDLVRETDACIYGLKVGETGSRVLKITLLENGSAYNIDSGITPRLRIKKPDNTIVYADCTVENNIITFDLSAHQQIYAAAGVAEAALELCSNEKAFVSCPFKIIIENQVVSNEEIESSDDFAALKKMEGKINEAYNTSIQAQNNLDKLENKVASVEQIPRNIKVWLDTTSYDKPTVMISCDVLDKFLDPTVAENDAYRLPIEVSKDRIGNHTVYLNSNLSAEFLWNLSEIKYSDSIAVCCYQIELTGAGEPIPIIRHFYPYSTACMLEQYILPLEAKIDSKKDMFYIAETSSLIASSDEYGNSFLDVKVDYSTLQKDGNGCIAVNTDVIADKDYVNSLVSGAVKRKVVEQLPTENIDGNTIYMMPADVEADNNIYNEFMYINGAWEQIGSTAVDLSGYATTDDLDKKENKLVGGNAVIVSEVENEETGEKKTVVGVDSTSVVLRGQYDTEMATKAKKSKLEPIRTVIIGDETTYQDADIISYSDEEATQVQKIAICVDDNAKPFHLKETWIKSYLPSRTDTTSTYKFICFPYTFVNLNGSGIPSSVTGMKLCNHMVDVSTLTATYYNQCYAKFDDEANAYYGFDTGNYASSSVDTMTAWRSWGNNPKMIQDNTWGNTQRSVMCNGALVCSNTEGVPLATGTKIEIYGVRKDED